MKQFFTILTIFTIIIVSGTGVAIAQILVPTEYVVQYGVDGNITKIIRQWGEWTGSRVGEGILNPAAVTDVVLDASGKSVVNVSTRFVVEETAEKSLLKVIEQTGSKVASRIVSGGTVIFELLWPISGSNVILLNFCTGQSDCRPATFGDSGDKSFITNAPGSYVVKWNALEPTSKTRCVATSGKKILDIPEDYFKSLPSIDEGSLVPNKWSGNWPLNGAQNFYDQPAGTYIYQLQCFTPAVGNWFTKFLDWLSLFGKFSQDSSLVRDLVVVQVKEPIRQQTLDVNLTAKPASVIAGQNASLTADVSGTAQGTIHYQFDCTNNGSYEVDVVNNTDAYTTSACRYSSPGKYTARAHVEQGNAPPAEDTVVITVASIPNSPSNTPPISEAGISTSPISGFKSSLTVTKGKLMDIYLSANQDVTSDGKVSNDPDGWTDPALGVSSGGKCEWNSNFNSGVPSFEIVKSNPGSPMACNIGPIKKIFNEDPGTYTYRVLRIIDKPGAVSNISSITVTVVAPEGGNGNGNGNGGGGPVCGNSVCEIGETALSCPSDCLGGGGPPITPQDCTVSLDVTPKSGDVPLVTTWTAIVSPAPQGPMSYNIDCGNGVTNTLSDPTGNCVYYSSGLYQVTVEASGTSCKAPAKSNPVPVNATGSSSPISTDPAFTLFDLFVPIEPFACSAPLIANPTSVIPPQSSILSWDCPEARTCTGTNFNTGGVTTNGTKTVNPVTNTTYTLSCTDPRGRTADYQAIVKIFRPFIIEVRP